MVQLKAKMEDQREERLNHVFHALSDPTRRALLDQLIRSPERVGALAEPFDMSLNAVSKHLKTLERAGLISRDTTGRTSICSLNRDPLRDAQVWLDQYTRFWNETLDSLVDHMHRITDTDEPESGAG